MIALSISTCHLIYPPIDSFMFYNILKVSYGNNGYFWVVWFWGWFSTSLCSFNYLNYLQWTWLATTHTHTHTHMHTCKHTLHSLDFSPKFHCLLIGIWNSTSQSRILYLSLQMSSYSYCILFKLILWIWVLMTFLFSFNSVIFLLVI